MGSDFRPVATATRVQGLLVVFLDLLTYIGRSQRCILIYLTLQQLDVQHCSDGRDAELGFTLEETDHRQHALSDPNALELVLGPGRPVEHSDRQLVLAGSSWRRTRRQLPRLEARLKLQHRGWSHLRLVAVSSL